jgi:YHS domain-containing protein
MKHKRNYLLAIIIVTMLAVASPATLAQEHQHSKEQPAGGKGQCAGCPMKDQGQQPGGMMQSDASRQDMETIHAMFAENKKIKRSVKVIANGIEATTESNDPNVKTQIIDHAFAMKERLINKQPIRHWDPLFAALFEHADKIELEIVSTEKGVKITETSTDPYVVKLIQAHAQGISEFVKEGMPSMHKRHELPGTVVDENAFLGTGDGVTTCPVTGEPVNKQISAEMAGRTLYFCCANCRDTAQKQPQRYVKP